MSQKILAMVLTGLISTALAAQEKGNYAVVNGLRMYYEIKGEGMPLLLVHGGGSTIPSNFGYWFPELAKKHLVIAVEMQAHGRTADIDRPLSFEQDADDLAELLKQLGIQKADIIGFSNGATTAMQFAIRHPKLLNKVVLASGNYKRDGMQPGFFDGMKNATLDMMPEELKTGFLKLNPDTSALRKMFDRDVARMNGFKDIDDALIRGVKSPALIINGEQDVVVNAHAEAIGKLMPNAKVVILPGTHGEYLGAGGMKSELADKALGLIEEFLK